MEDTRETLYLALDLAQRAVRLDVDLKIRDAYDAYWQSTFLLRHVMDALEEEAYRSDTDSDSISSQDSLTDIVRLAHIYDTYAERMALLASKLQPSLPADSDHFRARL